MIFRAVFCLALVAVLVPREPDLGFGRPPSAMAPRSLEAWLARTSAQMPRPAASIVGGIRARMIDGLASVEADIKRDQRTRARDNAL